jgi:hypothetical protein
MNYAEAESARAAARSAQSWANSSWFRVAQLERRLQASVRAGDGDTARLRSQLAAAKNIAKAASEDAAGWKRVRRSLTGR